MENIQSALENIEPASKNNQTQSSNGVLYDTTLDHILENLKENSTFIDIDEKLGGERFPNRKPNKMPNGFRV